MDHHRLKPFAAVAVASACKATPSTISDKSPTMLRERISHSPLAANSALLNQG